MKKYHLDNIYKNRYQEYFLADGQVYDSRQINWRLIEWEKVVQIKTHIGGKTYLTHCKNPGFKFFVIFRWAGQTHDENGQPKKIREWAVGWSDGEMCHMSDLDFKTGQLVKQYHVPIGKVEKHIHPRIEGRYATIPNLQ